jgi:hypothetical protein
MYADAMELIEKELTEKIIGACFEVSTELGAGSLKAFIKRPCRLH